MPVEPWLRWLTDTPWVARRPPKLCRFIAPAKPLPIETPVTSTFWPATKCSADELGADLDQGVGIDPELDQLALRLDAGLGEMAAHRLGHVLHLDLADAELQRRVAVLLLGALRHHLAAVDAQHRDRHMRRRRRVNRRDMPSFCAIKPVRIAASVLRA